MPVPHGSGPNSSTLFIGLMTGTSLDGVDAVLADFAGTVPTTLAHVHRPLPAGLRSELLALNTTESDEIHRSQMAAQDLARLYADATADLLAAAAVDAGDVRALGVHGQTVRHRPDLGYTVQLNAPALLAECTGVDVVADFRSRDIAAGGQGAPLVPAFHRIVFGAGRPRAVVNIGGISNITALDGAQAIGFDAGPGNVLIDAWMTSRFDAPFDFNGERAASGSVDERFLASLLREPYFALPPPKSTGRDLFTLDWVRRAGADGLDPTVVLASLTELTARAIGEALVLWAPQSTEVLVCGGGARNATLLRSLQTCVGLGRPVRATDSVGVPADQVEALAFAWLAWAHVNRVPGNLPEATGARGPRVLGALYPAA